MTETTPRTPMGPGLGSRARWLIAGGAVVAAVAIVAVALAVLSARPVPVAMTYIPRDSDVVVELRPDLPGDQQQRVGNLLAHFPGFEDQSTLARKLDESLARITSTVSEGTVDYASQVKPWLAGPLFAALDVSPPGPDGAVNWILAFTTDGSVTCDPFVSGPTAPETYRGLQIHVPSPGRGESTSCVFDGRHALVGSLALVKAGLDAHAEHAGVDSLAAYRTARDRLGGDRLATVFVGYEAMTAQLLAGMPTGLPSLAPRLTDAVAALPDWLIAGIRVEDDALVGDMILAPVDASGLPFGLFSPGAPPSLLTAPPAHVSALAPMLPANTVVLYEVHGTGVVTQNMLATLRATPGLAESLGQLDTALAALGGAANLAGWIGDAGVVVLTDGASVAGGVILSAPDAATAAAKVDQLRGFLSLAGLQGGVTISETTVDGTPVTLVDFGDAASLIGQLGGAGSGLTIPPGTRLVVSIAAHGASVLIGSGESFARQIIQTRAGSSLADQGAYKAAVRHGAASNAGQLYVAISPLRQLVEGIIPASERAFYESDVKPYLEPLEAILQTVTIDGGAVHARVIVTVN